MSQLVMDYLIREHNIITEMLGVLKNEMKPLRENALPDLKRFTKIIAFFRDYADTTHHEKEEKLLFTELYPLTHIEGGPRCIYFKELQLQRSPAIVQAGDAYVRMNLDPQIIKTQWENTTKEGHIVNPLLEEHILGRTFLKLIEFELKQRLEGETKDNGPLIDAIYKYVSMLEEHIDKENTCFAHTVETYLPQENQLKIVQRFQEMDKGQLNPLIKKSLEDLKELTGLER